MRGRKPLPTSLKILRGSRQPRNKNEPKPPSGKPKMPAWLSERGKKFWRLYAGLLHKKNLLTKFDTVSFAGLCETLGTLEEANEILQREGLTILGQSGVECKHPMCNVKKESLALLRSYSAEFGLTPSSRSRVTITESENENPLRALLCQKR